MKQPTPTLYERMKQRPENSKATRFLFVVAAVAIVGALLWLTGCAEPVQTVAMLVDEDRNVYCTKFFYVPGAGWVRWEVREDSRWIKHCDQEGNITTYRGKRLTTSPDPNLGEARQAQYVGEDTPGDTD